jgi:hypothetical protein
MHNLDVFCIKFLIRNQNIVAEVEKVVRCLLVLPATSCETERRLKTYLRSTIQTRINSVAVCHVHQQRLDNINVENILKTLL